ncbi:MAG: hypothetical protein H5T69_14550 [Chloroflexi bacterium]|nr:hypothetical protein [Chloroflexota bacterium]
MTKPKIAAIVTEYRPRSHADVIVGKFLRAFPTDEGMRMPRVEIASMYLDQVNPTDIGVETARQFGVPIYPSILRALTLGGEELAVDGVLIIGEHGEYPLNEKGQKLYPRRHLFEQVTGVLSTAKRAIPVFNDKHLAYNWLDAQWMYERALALGLPFMAGSSLPVCWRRPFLEYPLDTPLEAAVALGYGPLESYGFHALETLQCMVERRQGGETGVAAVQCLKGEAVWRWLGAHPAHAALAQAAGEAILEREGSWADAPRLAPEPWAFIVHYVDGLQAAVLMLNGYAQSFAFAGLAGGNIQACEFKLQGGNAHAHFSYLSLNIEEMFLTGKPTYPVERTLLTTGILAAAMDSRHQAHRVVPTPHLGITYTPAENVPHRPRGPEPAGATLDPWPPAGDALS